MLYVALYTINTIIIKNETDTINNNKIRNITDLVLFTHFANISKSPF